MKEKYIVGEVYYGLFAKYIPSHTVLYGARVLNGSSFNPDSIPWQEINLEKADKHKNE